MKTPTKIKYITPYAIFLSIISIILPSCRHKDIEFEDVPLQEVEVVFDWSKSPDADPASMALWLFYDPSESADSTLRYDFNNNKGGEIKIPYGSFSGLAHSSDNSDWAHFRKTEDIETFEIFTRDIYNLPSSGLKTRGIPKAQEAEDETMVETPKKIWNGRNDNMSLKKGEKKKTLVFYPEEVTCEYTVDIIDIQNLSSIDGNSADATLSGMSGGFMFGKGESSDTRHTLTFIVTKDRDNNSLHGEFLTFGESPKTRNPHKLGLYLFMTDGNKYFYSFDVSNQIYEAPDPKHVHIVVSGLSLPEPIVGGGGFVPDVNDWESVDIDLKM